MDVPAFLPASSKPLLKTIEMHTTGEPTRIVYSGFPDLSGTLLQQRVAARTSHDAIRRALMHELRGHAEMYGAVLRPETELTGPGPDDAHMGVLFLTHEGYSTMCGHATIAVARMLVDCHDPAVFPRRRDLSVVLGPADGAPEVQLRLHVPCGLVRAAVPVVWPDQHRRADFRADTARPVRFVSVPSFAAGLRVPVPIPEKWRWPALVGKGKAEVVVDVAYGGAFFLLASPVDLGFDADAHSLAKPDFGLFDEATAKLKAAFNASEAMRGYLHHPDHEDLQFLYSVILTQPDVGTKLPGSTGVETGLCFFGGDQQIDRSPTGSGVQARVALAHAQGKRKMGEAWTYHSVVSNAFPGGKGAFLGKPLQEVQVGDRKGVRVEVSGWAFYTGCSTYVVERDDDVRSGFHFRDLGVHKGVWE